MSESITLCVSPLSSTKNGQTVSNKDIFNTLSTSYNTAVSTSVLPTNCVHFLRYSRSYIVVQEFPPSRVSLTHYVSDVDVSRDTLQNNPGYRCSYILDRCSSCSSFEDSCFGYDGDYCCVSESCIDCEYLDTGLTTTEGFEAGDWVTFENIPLPRILIFSILGVTDVGEYFVRNTYLKALSEPLTNYDTTLYTIPIGNLYWGDNICWGENYFDSTDNLIFLSTIKDRFFNSPSNADLDGTMESHCGNEVVKVLGIPYMSTKNFLSALENYPTEYSKELLFNPMPYGEFLLYLCSKYGV